MTENILLTTTDNPYNPFTNFDEWFSFDSMRARIEQRPTICSLLARLTYCSPGIADEDNQQEIIDAINEIVEHNITGKYKKVTPEDAARTLI